MIGIQIQAGESKGMNWVKRMAAGILAIVLAIAFLGKNAETVMAASDEGQWYRQKKPLPYNFRCL